MYHAVEGKGLEEEQPRTVNDARMADANVGSAAVDQLDLLHPAQRREHRPVLRPHQKQPACWCAFTSISHFTQRYAALIKSNRKQQPVSERAFEQQLSAQAKWCMVLKVAPAHLEEFWLSLLNY